MVYQRWKANNKMTIFPKVHEHSQLYIKKSQQIKGEIHRVKNSADKTTFIGELTEENIEAVMVHKFSYGFMFSDNVSRHNQADLERALHI